MNLYSIKDEFIACLMKLSKKEKTGGGILCPNSLNDIDSKLRQEKMQYLTDFDKEILSVV